MYLRLCVCRNVPASTDLLTVSLSLSRWAGVSCAHGNVAACPASCTQVIEVTGGADIREQRIALSMKLVDQADGADLDPSNAGAEMDVSRGRGVLMSFMDVAV